MKKHLSMKVTILILILGLVMAPMPLTAGGGHDHAHSNLHEGITEAVPKGPHGGKLFTQENFSIEVTIFERGLPPEFRLFACDAGSPIDASKVDATIELTRFGDTREVIHFAPKGEYLLSSKSVEEPHSFEVKITAKYTGKNYEWNYTSFEGRTELSDEALSVAQLGIDTAGPASISNSTRVYGRLLANEDRLAHIGARFPGIVKEIKRSIGDRVERGEVLAIVESNQNLQSYEVRSLIAGVVLERHATLGEVVSESTTMYVVADLSQIWADFQVYREEVGEIVVGQKIRIELVDTMTPIEATVSYVSPIVDEVTQSKLIRTVLQNQKGNLRPGLFVSGVLTASEAPVALAVRRNAIQTFRDWDVVYLTDGHTFQAMPVRLGRRDSKYIEVLAGIEPGDKYVSKNSFVVKADIEKSEASHDH